MGRDTYGESGVGPPFRPALACHQSPQEAPETTPSCITSIATLTDAALLPQPPTRRICKPPSHTYIPSEAALATSSTFPGSPFRGGAAQPPGGAYNSGAFNSGIFSSSVLHSSGAYNSGPFGGAGHPARSSTGELYNSVALKKGVLVEFRGGSMETSEPSTRIGAARTALLPRSHGLGGTVYSADREAGSRSRGSAAHNSTARRLRKSTTVRRTAHSMLRAAQSNEFCVYGARGAFAWWGCWLFCEGCWLWSVCGLVSLDLLHVAVAVLPASQSFSLFLFRLCTCICSWRVRRAHRILHHGLDQVEAGTGFALVYVCRSCMQAPPPRASTDAKPAHKGGAFSRLSTAVAAAARARCACMGLGPPRAHKD